MMTSAVCLNTCGHSGQGQSSYSRRVVGHTGFCWLGVGLVRHDPLLSGQGSKPRQCRGAEAQL